MLICVYIRCIKRFLLCCVFSLIYRPRFLCRIFFVCVLLLLNDFNMFDYCIRDMLVAQVALCHLFEVNSFEIKIAFGSLIIIIIIIYYYYYYYDDDDDDEDDNVRNDYDRS